MPLMSVTLEVSRLSGWLKADAYCRVRKGASDRGTTRVAHGDVWHSREKGESAAHKACVCGPVRECGGRRRRRKCTSNMRLMSVTLEVSKLSGWLKARACCRVQREHPTEGRRVWHGEEMAQREGRANQQRIRRACVCGPQLGSVGAEGAGGSAHLEHGAHVCDAGGVKAQRLIENIRILPSPKGASDTGKRVWHTEMWHRGKGKSTAHAACVCGPAREWGQKAQAEAHIEHEAHVCDAGGVKAQRLVESIRSSLPSPEGAIDRGTTRVARRCGTEGRANQQRTQRACVAQLGSGGRRRRRKRT